MPGAGGTITTGHPDSRATSAATRGPAPPYAIRAMSRRSWPRSDDAERIALAMFAAATDKTPAAALSSVICKGFATCSVIAFSAALKSSFVEPSTKPVFASSLPRIRLASVNVAPLPPFP